MRISDWSSDVCSSDLLQPAHWVQLALDQNPTLRSRLLALEASEGDIATARAGHLPTLDATISYSDTSSYGQIVTSGSTFPTSSQGNDEIGRASCRERVCQ